MLLCSLRGFRHWTDPDSAADAGKRGTTRLFWRWPLPDRLACSNWGRCARRLRSCVADLPPRTQNVASAEATGQLLRVTSPQAASNASSPGALGRYRGPADAAEVSRVVARRSGGEEFGLCDRVRSQRGECSGASFPGRWSSGDSTRTAAPLRPRAAIRPQEPQPGCRRRGLSTGDIAPPRASPEEVPVLRRPAFHATCRGAAALTPPAARARLAYASAAICAEQATGSPGRLPATGCDGGF
mmetsp:Transcript_33486/g.73263  ORF Transcript_33486/g.73263 Transcript_33486/m.73263 type:complete len:242 (-) Transcript_33486:1195-1920(-)